MTDGATATLEPKHWAPAVANVLDLPEDPEPQILKAPAGVRTTGARAVKLDREELYSEFQPLVRRLIRQYGEDADSRCRLAGLL